MAELSRKIPIVTIDIIADVLARHSGYICIGSGQLRLVDIISHKIYCVNSSETLIDALAGTSTKSYRLEEIPLDQVGIIELNFHSMQLPKCQVNQCKLMVCIPIDFINLRLTSRKMKCLYQ